MACPDLIVPNSTHPPPTNNALFMQDPKAAIVDINIDAFFQNPKWTPIVLMHRNKTALAQSILPHPSTPDPFSFTYHMPSPRRSYCSQLTTSAETVESTDRETEGIASYTVTVGADTAAHVLSTPVLGPNERHFAGIGIEWLLTEVGSRSFVSGR